MNARKQGRLPVAVIRGAVPIVLTMLGLAACGDLDDPAPRTVSQDVAMAGVCVNPNSTPPNQRVDDADCGDPDDDGDASNGGFTYVWFSTGSSYAIPARGQTVVVTNGARHFAKGTVVTRGLPATGVPKLSDTRRYPPYVPAKPAPVAPPPAAKPAPVAPPPAVKPAPAPAPPPIQRGGLGSTSGGTKSGTSGGTGTSSGG